MSATMTEVSPMQRSALYFAAHTFGPDGQLAPCTYGRGTAAPRTLQSLVRMGLLKRDFKRYNTYSLTPEGVTVCRGLGMLKG